MRLDKYLKVTRLIKRRTIANDACDAGKITVGDQVAKASYQVKVGDVISIRFGSQVTTVKVTGLPGHVTKDTAGDYYETLQA